MFVLGAPEELEALVGLFGKLYVSTFDCATFYCQRIQHQEVEMVFRNDTPLRYGTGKTVFIWERSLSK